ncbi:Gpr1p Ecym_5264 [Eremothecium cymbalariae DBVPG|uniref:Uncharacterized protein n=1 Tax=Eremothecium cymbalariae (strain CBS 270.75 / DBVPG 7215 / KCTC 17166 / NRRL Y-17582) TaxID=931890 RepID=I6ND87_ERECY|nr:hypothetical protein Ecym_5264 [Eremothecium cymbalariae DBVPG\
MDGRLYASSAMSSSLRPLETLDINQMSVLSMHMMLDEYDVNKSITFHRPQTSHALVNPSVGAETSVGRRTSQYHDELSQGQPDLYFNYNDNSTPNRSPVYELQGQSHRIRSRNTMRTSSSGPGGAAFFKAGLSNTVSKLSLLDDQNLTSFPIPPPMKSQYETGGCLGREFNMFVHVEDTRISFNPSSNEWEESNELFLIEDYISDMDTNEFGPTISGSAPSMNKNYHSRKRMSISDLKSRIYKNKETMKLPLKLKSKRKLSLHSSLTLTPQIYPVDGDNELGNMAIITEDNYTYNDNFKEKCDNAKGELGDFISINNKIHNHEGDNCKEGRNSDNYDYKINENKNNNHKNNNDNSNSSNNNRNIGNNNNNAQNFKSSGCLKSRNTDQLSTQTGNTMVDNIEDVLCDMIKPTESAIVFSDKYLSDLPIKHQLKCCVICEKPLYELSALIPPGRNFQEIVCGGCSVKYENASKILEDYEFEGTLASMDDANNSIDSGFDEVPEVIVENRNKRQKTSNFSNQLITRLHLQSQQLVAPSSSHSFPMHSFEDNIKGKLLDPNTKTWLLEARHKLRWRWRVSGLLPRFLSKRGH